MECVNNNVRVSFSWDVHYKCNYRCPYCWWYGRWQDLSRLNRYLSVEEWVRLWKRVHNKYGCVYIELLGGEPLIYPNFRELVIELSKMHTLCITTNLSIDIKNFAESLDSKRVKIMPTFHPFFADFDTFLKKVLFLRERGLTAKVSYLAYPPQVKFINQYRDKFNQNNISFSVLTFWGNHNGIEYPAGYTVDDKAIIDGCLADRAGAPFQTAPKSCFKGKLCDAGRYYAVIQSNGIVVRCGGSELSEEIGSFFDENFKLLDEPLPCKSDTCKCNEWAFLIEKEDVKSGDGEAIDIFKENKLKNTQEVSERKVYLESRPLRLGVIVTNWCNLSCIMCTPSRHQNTLTLSASTILSKIDVLLPYLERIDWQGGEFFPFKDMKKMFSFLAKYRHITHEIITNGLLLDKEWIEILLELNICLSFSIDGATKETYEHIRRGGSYDRLIMNLNLIKELERKHNKTLKRNITTVVMKSNYLYLDNFVPFAQEYGFLSVSFNPIMHVDTEENIFNESSHSLQFLDEVRRRIQKKSAELRIGINWNLPTPEKGDASNSLSSESSGHDLFCKFPWKSLWISAEREGNIYSDCWCQKHIGNIFQDDLLEVWNNEKMQEFRRQIIARDTSSCNKACVSGYSMIVNNKDYNS